MAEPVFEAALDAASSLSDSASGSTFSLQRLRSLLAKHQTRRTICRLREVLTVSAVKTVSPTETPQVTAASQSRWPRSTCPGRTEAWAFLTVPAELQSWCAALRACVGVANRPANEVDGNFPPLCR